MDNSLIVEGLNIAQLSDEELTERLQNLGFVPGPILATTRSVYQRKLARLLRNEDLDDSDINGLPDAETSSSPILSPSFQNYSASPSALNYDELRRRPLSRVEGENWSEGPPILSPHKPWSMDDIVTRAPPPPAEAEKSSLSPTVTIIALVSVLLFAFFVYYNMESTPSNPLP